MCQTTETTRVNLKYTTDLTPSHESLGAPLLPALESLGHVVRSVKAVPGGAQFDLDEMQLTVTRTPDRPADIRILAIGADDGAAGSTRAKARFRLCATVARTIASTTPPRRIEWRHRGGFYISQGGRVAVVTGMRGTTGSGSRRKAAARAFSLYGPMGSRDTRPPVSTAPFRVGGRSRRSRPERLAQYALNATICCFSLPFGAALMTYGLLSGGSVAHSARWMALTALALSFLNFEMLQNASHLF